MPDQPKPNVSRRFPFAARIVLAILLGVLCGEVLGKRTEPLGQVGTAIINLIKALAGPLLFLAVVDAFIRTQVRGRLAARMVGISLTNAVIALIIGLTISNVLQPGALFPIPPQPPSKTTPDEAVAVSVALLNRLDSIRGTEDVRSIARESLAESREAKGIDVLREITGYIPRSVIEPFVDNSIITIVILAVMVGAALRTIRSRMERAGEGDEFRPVEAGVRVLFQANEVMIGWVVLVIPIAIFAVVARSVGKDGFTQFRILIAYVGVAVLGLAIQVIVVYQAWLVAVARVSLGWFWSGARDAVLYAVGSSSSLATMPVTLKCLDRMKVRPQAARMAACVGTNLNNDGILLYEAMAVLFVAQVHGIPMDLGQQIAAAGSCMIAGIGIAAIPDAGLISLALVLTTVGLPVELLPLLLTVDWLLSRARAVVNVVSDMVVAVVIDRLDGPSGDVVDRDPEVDSESDRVEKET